MSREHAVQPGECVTAIAVAYGFVDRQRVLDHPDNEPLLRARPNPNLLREGDTVVVPNVDPGGADRATGQRHRFVIQLPVKELRIVLKGHDGEPLVDCAYVLDLERELRTGTTDGEGKLVERVRIGTTRGVLMIAGRVLVLHMGRIGPIGDLQDHDVSGVQARLHNLGLDMGRIDRVVGTRTRAALAMFQAEHAVTVNGEPDAATRGALEDAHGC